MFGKVPYIYLRDDNYLIPSSDNLLHIVAALLVETFAEVTKLVATLVLLCFCFVEGSYSSSYSLESTCDSVSLDIDSATLETAV